MTIKEQITNEIDNNREQYIDFFRKVVQADSYNPSGNELNVGILIEEYLKSVDIESQLFPFGDNRVNLIASLNNDNKGKVLLYNGHMDVVPPGNEEEWTKPPLEAFMKRKRYIYGRGTTDMKGGLVAMVIALKIMKSLDIELSGDLILNAVADEETGGILGTKWCLDNALQSIKPTFTIIGEPTGLNPLPKAIILGEKGHLYLKVITKGISCHASMPNMGKNAIYMMSELIENLKYLNQYIPDSKPPIPLKILKKLLSSSFPGTEIFERILGEQPQLSHLLQSLVQFSYSVTMINAGIKGNVVPDTCEALIDIRLLPEQKIEGIIEGFNNLIKKKMGYEVRDNLLGKPEDVYIYIEASDASEGSYWDEWEDSKALEEFFDIVETIYKKKPFYLLYPASADAHYFRNDGYCPQTILFGPGSAGTAHAVNEFIEIEDFLKAIKVYTLFAYNYLKK
ncbi:MAG: M20 family metallopeptidase [Candidatus Lokiarchaeota archaeon]|nr:M20 family metallopeptidase [Candidatus Lokiarchaeota archaeon]